MCVCVEGQERKGKERDGQDRTENQWERKQRRSEPRKGEQTGRERESAQRSRLNKGSPFCPARCTARLVRPDEARDGERESAQRAGGSDRSPPARLDSSRLAARFENAGTSRILSPLLAARPPAQLLLLLLLPLDSTSSPSLPSLSSALLRPPRSPVARHVPDFGRESCDLGPGDLELALFLEGEEEGRGERTGRGFD